MPTNCAKWFWTPAKSSMPVSAQLSRTCSAARPSSAWAGWNLHWQTWTSPCSSTQIMPTSAFAALKRWWPWAATTRRCKTSNWPSSWTNVDRKRGCSVVIPGLLWATIGEPQAIATMYWVSTLSRQQSGCCEGERGISWPASMGQSRIYNRRQPWPPMTRKLIIGWVWRCATLDTTNRRWRRLPTSYPSMIAIPPPTCREAKPMLPSVTCPPPVPTGRWPGKCSHHSH